MSRDYRPDRGDFVWLDFTPQAGAKQAGRRPALILSLATFNVATGLAAVCPLTSTMNSGRFEVPLPRVFPTLFESEGIPKSAAI